MIRVLFIGLFLSAFTSYAEQDSSNVVVSKTAFNYGRSLKFVPFDTNLTQFHEYQMDGFTNKIGLGNIGSALSKINLRQNSYGFNLGENCFGPNYDRLADLEIYKALKPFARISYISGPKKYQDFNVFFTQNINSRINFAFTFRTFKSDGFYLNQETNGRLFTIQNSFKTKKGRYGYLTKFTVNSGYANENGGIKGDSLFNSLIQGNKLGVQVWMEGATNRYDNRKLELHQYFYLNSDIDSLGGRKGATLRLSNVGLVDDLWFEDNLTDSLYYDQFSVLVEDSMSTYDRSHLLGLKNRLQLHYDFEKSSVELQLGVDVDGYDVETIDSDTSLIEAKIFGGFDRFKLGAFNFSGIIEKGVYGFNEDGHRLKFAVESKPFKNRLRLGFILNYSRQLPDFKTIYYKSANLNWNNDFNYIGLSEYRISLKDDTSRTNFYGKIRTYSNYVYYGESVLPVQYSDNFTRYELGINKAFQLKSFHFDFNVIYQDVTNDAPVNVANWVWKVSVYHQRYLFKEALEFRYGIDYWQTSSYNGDNYAPFARTFTYQDSYSVGNYPFFNFYISARIKSAQGFVNFQNIGQLFLDDSYMMVPYYPLQDFGISFGLRWDFYN